jgi:hypothetical protein
MIKFDQYDKFGTTYNYVTIDLSTTKHRSRVLDFLEDQNPATGEHQYIIKAQWTPEKYHPTMILSKDELIQFSIAIEKMVNVIHKK